MRTENVDSLIVGGGPAGAATGLLLARAGWKVTLVERKRFPRRKVCGEYLSATNMPLLRHLGIAKAFEEQAGPPNVQAKTASNLSGEKTTEPVRFLGDRRLCVR